MPPKKFTSRQIVAAIVCGLVLSMVTGFIENPPEASITTLNYYGYPLVWRVTELFGPAQYRFGNFAIDCIFWIAVSFLVLVLIKIFESRANSKYDLGLLPLIMFVPLGFVMDLVHELGHAIWGTTAGGNLNFMQIAYLEIYPRLAMTSRFVLGYARVTGIPTQFGSGLYLLGGSLTTNLTSWLLALSFLKMGLDFKTEVVVKILGLWGLLDLPLYVLLPQIGFHHWLIIGGSQPEPLVGARRMGIPDLIFYTLVVLTTVGLIFFYFKPLRQKVGRWLSSFSEKTGW